MLLCMGVAILNRVMQKKVPDRNRAFLQALAFLQVYFLHVLEACLESGCPAFGLQQPSVYACSEGDWTSASPHCGNPGLLSALQGKGCRYQ